jgi:hypothetical protein
VSSSAQTPKTPEQQVKSTAEQWFSFTFICGTAISNKMTAGELVTKAACLEKSMALTQGLRIPFWEEGSRYYREKAGIRVTRGTVSSAQVNGSTAKVTVTVDFVSGVSVHHCQQPLKLESQGGQWKVLPDAPLSDRTSSSCGDALMLDDAQVDAGKQMLYRIGQAEGIPGLYDMNDSVTNGVLKRLGLTPNPPGWDASSCYPNQHCVTATNRDYSKNFSRYQQNPILLDGSLRRPDGRLDPAMDPTKVYAKGDSSTMRIVTFNATDDNGKVLGKGVYLLIGDAYVVSTQEGYVKYSGGVPGDPNPFSPKTDPARPYYRAQVGVVFATKGPDGRFHIGAEGGLAIEALSASTYNPMKIDTDEMQQLVTGRMRKNGSVVTDYILRFPSNPDRPLGPGRGRFVRQTEAMKWEISVQ